MILLSVICVVLSLEFGIATAQENTMEESGLENEEPSPVQERERQDTSFEKDCEILPACGLDEEYKKCTCPPDTCMSLVAKFKCGSCEPGCACRSGYLRLTKDAPCRPMRECPQLAHSPDYN